MADLRIYDYNLNLLCIESEIVSVSAAVWFNDIGKLEIHLKKDTKALKLLFEEKYLLVCIGNHQGIVTGVQMGKDCVIYAKTPNWILTRKTISPFKRNTNNFENFLREKVLSVFDDFECFSLGEVCGMECEMKLEINEYISLFDFVKDTLSDINAGHSIEFDTVLKKWIFKMRKQKETPLVISESLLNCYDTEYVRDLQEYFTFGFYERELTQEETDEDVPYAWEECEKEEKSSIYKWETVLSKETDSDAQKELSKYKIDENITAKLKNIKYGKDYDIGDIITMQFMKGDLKKTQKMKVSGVEFWHEAGDTGEAPRLEKTEETKQE